MVVRKAQNIEARITVVLRVARRRAEQVTRLRVAAFLRGLATFHQDALEIAESEVSRAQDRRHIGKKADAVIIGQVIPRVIRADHHVANSRNPDTLRRFVGFDVASRRWRILGRDLLRG